MSAGRIISALKDVLAVGVEILETAQHEIAFLIPASVSSIAGASCDTMPRAKRFIENGGVLRGITTVSLTNLEETRTRMDMGEDLRHSDVFYELFMVVGDRQQSVSAMNIGVYDYTLDTPVIAFWSEDPTYAEYLLASFESAWSKAVPAEKRMQELEQGAGQG